MSRKRFRSRAPKKRNQAERSSPRFQGRVQKNPRGFAFIVPLHAEFEDAFVSPQQAESLLDGDIVEFVLQSRGPRTAARILRIVQRRTEEVVGQVVKGRDGVGLITSKNEFFSLTDADRLPAGEWVSARLKGPKAEVAKRFGTHLTPQQDIPITIARFGLHEAFSQKVLSEAPVHRERAQQEIEQGKRRRDLRALPFVTIDGEDAKDFDDAIYVERGPQNFTLFVAIADVSFFVRPGTRLDEEARERATSVYFPGFCLPMLPEFLSNDLCSLRPQEDKLAVVAEIRFSNGGTAQGARFYEALIKTQRRLTYTEVQAFFDNPKSPGWETLSGPLKNALALYRKLDDQRRKRGVLDFDLPESKIQVDKEGRPISVQAAPRFTSHKLIEEFMIAANRAVAKALRERKVPALYRVHEPPDADSLAELNSLLKNLGMTHRITDVSPRAFARVLESTAELKSANTIHHMVLRLQKQARYLNEPKGHFGLALADYAHFTSPIRRYPDLVVHRALKSLNATPAKADKASRDLSGLGDHTSEMERKATEAERFIVRRKQCWYFLDRLGEEYDGIVAGITKNGLFVALGEMASEGFVPLEFMDGYYQFDERRMCLRRRPGNETLGLGDGLRVQVLKVSVEDNQITLGMVR